MPMLAMAYMATHLDASANPRITPMTGMPSQKATRLFQTSSQRRAKSR